MMAKQKTFCVEIPDPDSPEMDLFQEAMNAIADANVRHIKEVEDELGVGFGVAADIVYLRGRTRWTQEKEDCLIALAKAGKPLPNIMEDF